MHHCFSVVSRRAPCFGFFEDLLDEQQMNEFRNSPIVNIEVHDRDERESARRRMATVFGSERADQSIGRVSSRYDIDSRRHDLILVL